MNKETNQILTLYEENYGNIYRFALKKLGSHADAQDAAQEVFGRLIRRNSIAGLSSPTGYIWRIARNLIREIRRTRAIRSRWMSPSKENVDEHASKDPGPDDVVENRQMHEKILHTLNNLPPRRREVFILHRFKGLSHKEIADQLNISPKTVENHMVKALLFLRKHLRHP